LIDGEVDSVGVFLEAVLVFGVSVFDGLPVMLDGIEIGGVGWQISELALICFDELPHFGGLMESGIIHDDGLSWYEGRA
jgi:hypothetical protein